MLDMWNESNFMEEEQDDFLEYQSSLTYDDLEDSGQPVRPLEFPTPVVYDAVFADIVAADHRTGVEYPLKNVLVRKIGADRAYLIKKKLAKSTYGSVKLAVVLERINDDAEEREGDNDDDGVFNKRAEWRSTGEFAVIKCSSWDKIQSLRGRHLAEPIKEISVLQLLGKGSGDSHVVGCLEVLQDDYFLYTIMPYCAGGDLMGKLEISGIQSFPDEDEVRHYFKQLLSVSWHWCILQYRLLLLLHSFPLTYNCLPSLIPQFSNRRLSSYRKEVSAIATFAWRTSFLMITTTCASLTPVSPSVFHTATLAILTASLTSLKALLEG